MANTPSLSQASLSSLWACLVEQHEITLGQQLAEELHAALLPVREGVELLLQQLLHSERLDQTRDARHRGAARPHGASDEPGDGQREVRLPVGGDEVDAERVGGALKGVAAQRVRGTATRAATARD